MPHPRAYVQGGLEMTNVNELAGAIVSAVQQYTAEVETAIPGIVDDSAAELVQEIRSSAPKRSGKYAKGWTARKLGERVRSREGYAKLVCNPKRYYLAHLLEYGHAKRGGGRVSGKPHIRPAHDRVVPGFENKLRSIVKR